MKEIGTWGQQPLLHLIKECDRKARETREKIKERDRDTNMKYFRYCVMSANKNIISRSEKEAIRIIHAKKKEDEHAKEKCGYNYDLVDAEAMNSFRNCTT